jgi:hypothetical protein
MTLNMHRLRSRSRQPAVKSRLAAGSRLAFAILTLALSVGVASGAGSILRGHGTTGGSAGAQFGEPPRAHLLLGVVGPDPAGFDQLTGKHHALHVMFANWAGDVAGLVNAEYADGRLPVLSLASALSPAAIASGGEDARYMTLSSAVNGTGENVWVRVLPEMNGNWNAWSAYDVSGRLRGPGWAQPQFIRAFRRIALILRGGATASIDSKLRAIGQPPLRVTGDIQPSGKVAIIWNPQGHGTPYVSANGPAAYWPGAAYADIVADDLYSDSGEPSWQGMNVLYAYGKPFMVAEWGLKGNDDPTFTSRMFSWVATHPRTIGLVYFNKGWSGGSDMFELASKPRSLAIYRQAIRAPRYLATLP